MIDVTVSEPKPELADWLMAMMDAPVDAWDGDWWHAYAPEPEPPYPDPPDGWEEPDDEDVPHWDTPGGL